MRELITMATSRRLIFTSTFFRIHRTTLTTTSSPSLSQTLQKNLSISNHKPLLLSLRFSKTSLSPSSSLFPKLNLFHRYSSSSATIANDDNVTDNGGSEIKTIVDSSSHPWPEWVNFIDKLKSKGFLNEEEEESLSSVENDDDGGGGGDVSGYNRNQLNVLRNASLTFARERFDIFKSLSREHIQAVVECGCPSLFRKAVNSAKRLRAFIRLDEGDVCSACNLRGSCDRAYVILKESETSARTVDIVRMLLIYALDPLVLSGGERPHGREHVETSARKLLSELTELSETPSDPALPKPAVKPPKQIEQSENFVGRGLSQSSEMKRGDWICSKCNFMNFSRNVRCLECRADGPKRVSVDDVEMKKGDWTCPQCQFMNFARNKKCLRCEEKRPQRELNPGDWECPSCDFLNYRRNTVCLKCNCNRPKDDLAEYEERIWKSPHQVVSDRS